MNVIRKQIMSMNNLQAQNFIHHKNMFYQMLHHTYIKRVENAT